MTVNGKTVAENLKDVPGISELGAQVMRVPKRFFGIRDFPCLKLGIRDFKAKSGRDSGLFGWLRLEKPKPLKTNYSTQLPNCKLLLSSHRPSSIQRFLKGVLKNT